MKMGKHALLMMAGCGVMLVGIVLLPLLGVRLGGVLPFLFVLACPLSMLFMMGSMGGSHGHAGHGQSDQGDDHGAHSKKESDPRALSAPGDQN